MLETLEQRAAKYQEYDPCASTLECVFVEYFASRLCSNSFFPDYFALIGFALVGELEDSVGCVSISIPENLRGYQVNEYTALLDKLGDYAGFFSGSEQFAEGVHKMVSVKKLMYEKAEKLGIKFTPI